MTQYQNNTQVRRVRDFFHSARMRKVFVFLFLAGIFLVIPNIYPVSAADGSGDPWYVNMFKYLIYIFFAFFGWLTSLAAQIFVWVIDASTFDLLMNHSAMYAMWRIIRDFCNLFFIVILLFSAFATIFQLEKYDYRKTLPMLIIMAILVNFSFPISRFIIDLSNVVMYFFAQNIFKAQNASSISQELLSVSNIKDLLLPHISDPETSVASFGWKHLLAATICMFLFGISFLILALMLLIRMVTLAILVVFSPIGFAGLISPAVRKFGSDWWDKLFRWSTYGPIAIMFVLISIKFMQVASETIHPENNAEKMLSVQGDAISNNFIASVAFFAIPITLFWVAITSTQKYSSEMSSAVTSFAINNANRLRRFTQKQVNRGVAYTYKQSGIPGGIQTWLNERTGRFSRTAATQARENREARRAGKLLGDLPARMEALKRKRTFEQVEQNKKNNRPQSDLKNDIRNGLRSNASEQEKIQAHAAALTMADKEMFENTEDFTNALHAVGNDMDSINKIIRKAPKDILRNGGDLAQALEAVGKATSGMNDRTKAQMKALVIEKADGNALDGDPRQLKRVMESFGTDTYGEELRNAFEGKMKKEGKIKSLIDFRIDEEIQRNPPANEAERNRIRSEQYEKTLKNYNAENLARQSKLMDDENFRRYFKEKLVSGAYKPRFYLDYIRKAEGNREGFEEAVRGRKLTDEDDILSGGGMPS